MLILPTEKRIDWRHPPYVLLLLVLANILVFVLYQSGDDEKRYQAFNQYTEQGFYDFEAEAYLEFLQQRPELADDPVAFEDYRLMAEDSPDDLTEMLLLDRNFLPYLQQHADEWVPEEEREAWALLRPQIDRKIASVSYLQLGLIPQQWGLVTLISHQFLHGGWMHLIGNMVFLLICGFAVEAALGSGRFLLFYLLSGICGGLLYGGVELYRGEGGMPLVGASGAISGVMAMYLVLFRLQKIEFFYWFFVFIGYFRAPALLILPFYIGNELYSFMTEQHASVAYMAHVGGFLGGAALVGLALFSKPDSINQDYLEQDQRVDPYQEKLSKVYRLIGDFQFALAQQQIEHLIAEYGERSELLMQRFHLLRIDGGDNWYASGQRILRQTGFNHAMINDQLKVWSKAEAPLLDGLSDEEKIQLGIRFMEVKAVDEAEVIARELAEGECRDLMLGRLLHKLADYYQQQNHPEKQRFFQALMESARQGGMA